jgi:transcriptional regulator with XRE-family HTH domain
MTRLMALIETYRDEHGAPSYASIARSIGISSQALSAWKQRDLKEPPHPDTLRRLAEFISRDYETVVLRAALLDAGWVTEEPPRRADSDSTSEAG